MNIQIVAYREEFVDAVRDFNHRLTSRGVALEFPTWPISRRLAKSEGRQTYQERFLAVDNGTVRGGYILKHQPFWMNGAIRPIGCLYLPISEGVIDKSYAMVGAFLFVDALRRQPLLYLLGVEGPVMRMAGALGWPVKPVASYFRVVHPAIFLRQIVPLSTSRLRRRVLDALAYSGLGWTGIRLLQAIRPLARVHDGRVDGEVVDEFADWDEELWRRCKDEYAMIGARDPATLRTLYPKKTARFIRLKVTREGSVIGWAVMLAPQIADHKQFGRMKVGSIVDCLARCRDADLVVRVATDYLEQTGVDLIVSNQFATAWRRAFLRSGYLRGPSNLTFSVSRGLALLLDPVDRTFGQIHLTRGDGEGPTSL